MRHHRISTILIVFAAAALLTSGARGQYPVDNQVGQIDNRVNGELYGNNEPTNRTVPYQTRVLPSEVRFARWRSGALPSEIEMNRAAFGPITQNGEIDYIPRQSPLQRAMGLPEPQLYNPAYDPAKPIDRRVAQQQLNNVPGGYPQNAREGMQASYRIPGALVTKRRPTVQPVAPQPPAQQPQPPKDRNTPTDAFVPALTPAPYEPLPTGQLNSDIRYTPYATPGAVLIHHPRPQPRDKSLADPQNQNQQNP
jgi:hypothetical protein